VLYPFEQRWIMVAPNDIHKADWPPHLDAVTAAPKNHRVLWEDDQVRVLEVNVEPGEREELHHHQWPSIMILLARPKYRNYDENGREIEPAVALPSEPVFPLAVRLPAQRAHYVEVLSKEPQALRAIRVELKAPGQ
jgi:hypothetical protein